MKTSPIKLSSATREFWEIPILYEDEHLLALDKPSGLLTSPDRSDPNRPSLMKLLHAGITDAKPWAKERGLSYLINAHRLDFETSGVILLAKSKPVLVELANMFGSEKPIQVLSALVRASDNGPVPRRGQIRASPSESRLRSRRPKARQTRPHQLRGP